MRSGHSEAIRYVPQKVTVIEQIKRTWVTFPGRYSTVIGHLCYVIIRKLTFHRSYPFIPGDLEIPQKVILESIGSNPEKLFDFCLALLDYLETLLNFQQLVFESVENSGLKTLGTNNCRLAALTQCVQDCAALYDLSLKAMIRLHAMLSPDMLSDHRERFARLYFALERFFVRANTFPFIRDLLKIPLLPNNPPNFLDATGQIQSIKVIETADSGPDGQLVDLNTTEAAGVDNEDWKNEVSDATFEGILDATQPAATAHAQNEYLLEIEMLKSEVQRVQNEGRNIQDHLFDRIRTLEEEIKTLVQVKSRQDEQLTLLVDEVKNRTATSSASEEKYVRIRDAYAKLRDEHVKTLKQLSGLQAQCSQLQTTPNNSDDSRMEARVARQLLERLRRAACDRATEDSNAIAALLENPDFVQCRSCADLVTGFGAKTTAELLRLKEILSSTNAADSEVLPLEVANLAAHLNATVLHAKALSNSAASIEIFDELGVLCRRCLSDSLAMYSKASSGELDQSRRSEVVSHVDGLVASLGRIQVLAKEFTPQIKDVNPEDLASSLEDEMRKTEELIARAEARFRELLEESKSSMTGIQLEVHSKILDSCTELMAAIALLVAKSRELQEEIVSQGRGTATVKEFYKRHNRWTEGLFSAAKSVGAGANLLVETADAIVTGRGGQVERLVVAALEISSSTTQLLVSSRVKASTASKCLTGLENAAKEVSKMTGKVVAAANNASSTDKQMDNMDFAKLSFTQAHKEEVDTQVRVLELEAQLTAERMRLAEIRRFNYSNSAEFEQNS